MTLFATVTFVLIWPLVIALWAAGYEEWDITNLPWEMVMRTSCTAWGAKLNNVKKWIPIVHHICYSYYEGHAEITATPPPLQSEFTGLDVCFL